MLLSISPIYKDIVSPNTSVKLFALKTLPSLGIEEMTHLMLASLKQIVVDKNQLVRKLSALAILKLRDLSPEEITSETYQEPLDFLLKDSPQVRNAAIYVMGQLTNDLSFMHQRYFQLIKDLPSLNHLEIERSLR